MTGKDIVILIVIAAAALYGGYWYGDNNGYDRGYDAGLTDAAKIEAGQEPEVKVDTGYKNPYEGVNLNPFR